MDSAEGRLKRRGCECFSQKRHDDASPHMPFGGDDESRRKREEIRKNGKEMVDVMLHPEKGEAAEGLKLQEGAPSYESEVFRRVMKVATVVMLAAMLILSIIGYRMGIFRSQQSLITFVNGLGIWAPVVFTLIQAVQVVIPILPGAIGCAVGVVAFGPWWGLVYNYIGICAGSIAAFLLSRHYGKPFVIKMVGEKNYKKYIGWTGNSKRYERLFALLIFLPVAPDDILCFITGLTEMTLKKYIFIILTCKPASIALYSLGLTAFMSKMWQWLTSLTIFT